MDTPTEAGVWARLRAAVRARLPLHENWCHIALNAWSVRFAVLAAVCDGVAMLCGFFTDAPENLRPWFAGVGMVATVAAPIARLIPQDNIPAATAPQGGA
jgi:hypothetical protein